MLGGADMADALFSRPIYRSILAYTLKLIHARANMVYAYAYHQTDKTMRWSKVQTCREIEN